MPDAAFAQIASPPFTGLHGDGGVDGGLRLFAGSIKGAWYRQVLFAGLAQRFHHRQPDVAHGFIPGLGFAAIHHPFRAFAEGLLKLFQRQALMGLGHLGGANKEGAEQRAAGPADVGEQRHTGIFKNETNVFIGN